MKFKGFLDDQEHDIEVRPIEGGFEVVIGDTTHRIDAAECEGHFYSLIRDGVSYDVSVRALERGERVVRHGGYQRSVRLVDPLEAAAAGGPHGSGVAEVKAVMPGRVVKLLVEEGAEVKAGEGLIVLEAMKMENEVAAPQDGRVGQLLVSAGQTLESGDLIAVVEAGE